MEKLIALLAKGHFDYAEDRGDEEVELYFEVPDDVDSVYRWSAVVELDDLAGLELKTKDGQPVDFSEIYEDNGRNADGTEKDEEDEEDEDNEDA